jgi:hypothetical protein
MLLQEPIDRRPIYAVVFVGAQANPILLTILAGAE